MSDGQPCAAAAAGTRGLVRDAAGADRLRLFLIGAAVTILLIRVFLGLTGYPRISGGGLHVAHVLWGGLAMLAAQLLSMLFLGSAVKDAAAVLAGVGFGLFIDEVGKFLTTDNNYFYAPVAAIIYAVLVLTYAVVKLGINRRALTDREHLANSAARRADRYVRSAAGGEPGSVLVRIRDRGRAVLVECGRQPFINRATAPVIALFTLFSLGRPLVLLSRNPDLANTIYAAFAVTGFVLGVLGLWRALSGRRAAAYGLFEVALMVELLVVQVFWLLDNEFAGIPLVLANVVLLTMSRTLLLTSGTVRLSAAAAGR